MASPPSFPPPIIIPPSLPSSHTQTFIILHGRGSSSSYFASPFISTPFSLSSAQKTLQSLYPTTKFIFPSAPYSRATIYKRSLITQWFDSWHLDGDDSFPYRRQPRHENEEWRAIEGLQATISYIHNLIKEETALLAGGSTRNIVLGGISQGCAASLAALILWDGEERLGGYLGMCGWLPFAETIKKEVTEKGEEEVKDDDEWDPFQRDDGEDEETTPDKSAAAVRTLRECLELNSDGHKGPISRPKAFDTPVFLGHGDQDPKVPLAHGKEAAECLKVVGFNNVSWNEYQGLGHWYSPEMLTDMVTFLRGQKEAESKS
ncbi:Alpha/Beta hydrolase protein [Podospora fimiseda]|uniref:Alpha/Beta hydrolase protein n=1 Tax=Podospora fimiseda TaxID=252190 RepID=A0AAN7BSN8_9PEZI|nr:Alpha/Beta hydrolase protein [Podospora fimiseda]